MNEFNNYNRNKIYDINEIYTTVEGSSKKELNEKIITENNNESLTINYITFNKINDNVEQFLIDKFEDFGFRSFYNGCRSSRYFYIIKLLGDFKNDKLLKIQKDLNQLVEESLIKFSENNKEVLLQKEEEKSRMNKIDLSEKKLDLKKIQKTNKIVNLDYMIQELFDKSDYLCEIFEDNATNLNADIDFQRDLVWSLEQKQNLIISLINDLPIGVFYINRHPDPFVETRFESIETIKKIRENFGLDNILYDGKQRLTAIKDFIENKFNIEVNGEKYFFVNLDKDIKRTIRNTSISIIETEFSDKDELIKFYLKINTGGSLHSKEQLQKAIDLILPEDEYEEKLINSGKYRRLDKNEDFCNAAKDCNHLITSAGGGGIKCIKCSGWFCY